MENNFDPENPLCPVCGGQMFDNRLTKTNPKAPDFRCQDAVCKYEQDRNSGKWVVSKFNTSVWMPRSFMGAVKNTKQIQKRAADAETIRQENIKKNMDRKEDNIAWSNAKNNATLLVCHVNIFRMIAEEGMLKNKIMNSAIWLYSQESPAFKL